MAEPTPVEIKKAQAQTWRAAADAAEARALKSGEYPQAQLALRIFREHCKDKASALEFEILCDSLAEVPHELS